MTTERQEVTPGTQTGFQRLNGMITALLVFLAFGLGVGLMYFLNASTEERLMKAISETRQEMKQLKDGSVTSKGEVVNYQEIEDRVRKGLGKEMLKEVRATGGHVSTLQESVAVVEEQVRRLRKDSQAPPVVRPDGSWAKTFTQDRDPGQPPLTALSLTYDPKKTNPFDGDWLNNKEVFTIGSVTWRTGNDGVRGGVKVEREVFKSGVSLGKETLKIDKSDIYVPVNELKRFAPYPKWTFTLMTSIDTATGAKGYTFDTTKWIRRDWGFTLGYSKVGPAKSINFGASYNVGSQ